MTIFFLLFLLGLSFNQNCSAVSPYCTSCQYISTEISCNACSTNSFRFPVVINNGPKIINNQQIWTCRLCQTLIPGCMTCLPSINSSNLGSYCTQCKTIYTLGTLDNICYYCPSVSQNCIVNSCSQIEIGVFSCSHCDRYYFISPIIINGTYYTKNGSLAMECRRCQTVNKGCLTCSYSPTLTFGINCTDCVIGYGLRIEISGCLSCPPNCFTCIDNTLLTSNPCGSIGSSDCGKNGLMCVQCNTNYTIGDLDQRCYYCPNVSTNCLVNSCFQVGKELFSCIACDLNISFPTIMKTSDGFNYQMKNGQYIWICKLCTDLVGCLACLVAPALFQGVRCTSCQTGYAIPFKTNQCYQCGIGCLVCKASIKSNQNECGSNIAANDCGTNGLMCTRCNTDYNLNSNGNCYLATTGTSASVTQQIGILLIVLIVLIGVTSIIAIICFTIKCIREKPNEDQVKPEDNIYTQSQIGAENQ